MGGSVPALHCLPLTPYRLQRFLSAFAFLNPHVSWMVAMESLVSRSFRATSESLVSVMRRPTEVFCVSRKRRSRRGRETPRWDATSPGDMPSVACLSKNSLALATRLSASGMRGMDSRMTTRFTPKKRCRALFGMRLCIILSRSSAAAAPSAWKSGLMLDRAGEPLSQTYGSLSIPSTASFPETMWGQVCIASRGKVKKLCMEVNAGTSADVSIRALRGSGGLKSP